MKKLFTFVSHKHVSTLRNQSPNFWVHEDSFHVQKCYKNNNSNNKTAIKKIIDIERNDNHNDNINPLSANHEKWSNTLKQIVGNLPTICFSVFDQRYYIVFPI